MSNQTYKKLSAKGRKRADIISGVECTLFGSGCVLCGLAALRCMGALFAFLGV